MPTQNEDHEPIKIYDVSLKFRGGLDAEYSNIDLYDLSTSIMGLYRSLAIVNHYFFNNEIITKAPYAKDIRIITTPPKEGSFEIIATLFALGAAAYKVATAPRDTPIGHIAWSLYDLAVRKIIGTPLDYNKSLFYKYIEEDDMSTPKIESLSQKIDTAIQGIHRPILTQSADTATLSMNKSKNEIIHLDSKTLDTSHRLIVTDDSVQLTGRVAGYSANTQSGMIYVEEEKRAIPFNLEKNVELETTTLSESLMLYDTIKIRMRQKARSGFFKFVARKVVNYAGVTKKYYIVHIYSESLKKIPHELD